jgi:hypothetical protein
MKAIIAAILLMMSVPAMAQRAYSVTKDTVDGGKIFNGIVTFDNLAKEQSFDWFTKGKEDYKPEDKPLGLLKFYLRQYKMIVFMGTWCDDSHNLIPKLAKVLEYASYPSNLLTMYGVDRAKTTVGNEQRNYQITNVPTIILFKDDQEAGRITETVKTSVEADLAAILEQEMAGSRPH